MTLKTELERLVAVETKLDAVIEQNKELSQKLDALLTNYVPRTEYDKDMDALDKKIESSKKRTALFSWITGALSALFGAVMMILIQSYFTK